MARVTAVHDSALARMVGWVKCVTNLNAQMIVMGEVFVYLVCVSAMKVGLGALAKKHDAQAIALGMDIVFRANVCVMISGVARIVPYLNRIVICENYLDSQ
jgi:hypothetical protein